MERIEVDAEVLTNVVAEAAGAPGREVCGLLFGTDRRIVRTVATANVSPTPEHAFEADPAALFAALRAERAGGPRLLGHYHSHPNGSAEPSPRDLAAAEPGKLWLILGGGEARLWLAEAGGFREIAMVIARD